jgi:3-oxoacyl-(acyl-carrier-protein) synthase
MLRRVKITGIGPVTPAGIGREAFFRGINEPVSRVRAITHFDPEAGKFVGAEVLDFNLKSYAPEENPKRLSRHTQFGLVAAMLALKDANITPHELAGLNVLVATGSAMMDIDKISRGVQAVARKGARYSLASTVSETSSLNVASKIADLVSSYGAKTRMFSLHGSCCSGIDAVGQAANLVASGQADLAMAGGSESPLTFHPLLEFNTAELSPTDTSDPARSCRPFDLWRTTGVLGEGAAILVLEPAESPRPAYAWITGYGYANDPDGLAGTGIADALLIALTNSRHYARDINFINAWGPGHRQIDANEAYALKKIFGAYLREIPAVSIKGSIGTALGAAGAIQIASTALSLTKNILPPTVNWETPDPSCGLNLSSQPRHFQPNTCVVTAHGLLGSNTAVVLERS